MFALQSLAAFADTPGQTELLPSFDNPKLHFGTGAIVQSQEQLDPATPAIPGTPSKWDVTQWNHSNYMTPEQMTTNSPATADPVLGPASYGFAAPDQHSHVWIYMNGPHGHPVYELFERGGNVTPKGGSNVFLSAKLPVPANFSRPMTFSMQAKISRASISYNTPTAQQTGAVLGMAFIGFGINFPSPENGSHSLLFLQISLATSRGSAPIRRACLISDSGKLAVLMGGSLSGSPPLAFAPSTGKLTSISFSMNEYINTLMSTPMTCASHEGPQQISLQNVDPGSIVVKSIYIGLETQDEDRRKQSKYVGPQGQVELGLQISNVHLTD